MSISMWICQSGMWAEARCVGTYQYQNTCMDIYMYIYAYLYIYIYTYTYIYAHVHLNPNIHMPIDLEFRPLGGRAIAVSCYTGYTNNTRTQIYMDLKYIDLQSRVLNCCFRLKK